MLFGDDDRFRLVALGASSGQTRFTVYSAATLEAVDSAAGALIALFSGGVPVLIAGVGLTVWLIVGRTLRPVEEIRTEVASITEEELHRRVPVPEVDDEIGRLASTMNQMLSRLEVSSQQQRRFVADASHELRSPLAAIRSQLEVDLAHPDSADLERTHAEVLDETLRLQRLVEALLLLARSDAGALVASRGTVDVDDVVLEQVSGLIPTTDVSIDATAVTGAQVAASAHELAFVIRNILENAARYAESRVEVSLVAEHGIAKLTIDDDGPGIADEDRDRVFERFTRLDEARDRAHGGAGLGLAIARDITHHLRGAIEVERSPLGGARFIVTFPANGA
jgi:signal transduction histidine kinase